MYPIARFFHHYLKYRNAPALSPTDTHECTVICWPWDIDPWRELNNGRTLTLYDLGRIPLAKRVGMIDGMRENGWSFTVAGSSIRYRRRVRVFDKLVMKSRTTCWDDRFLYMEQSMWNTRGECTSHMLLRCAVTSRDGIVPAPKFAAAFGYDAVSPPIPDWIQDWINAEAKRPWPPMQEGTPNA